MVTVRSAVVMLVVVVMVATVEAAERSRVVRTRQGQLQGKRMLLPKGQGPGEVLGAVEAFLGVPYAAPPVGRLRFMPPGSPRSWEHLRPAREFGPVCPQLIPDLSDEKEALRFMTVGRLNYLKKLFVYLRQGQSEDCLHLNIYSPEMTGAGATSVRRPVIVFIHGESYEWNSGNPYDGSVLASYGQVIVVTLNYRLGLLGFLKTRESNQMGNYGLLDILAALHWIQENISQFGGDPGCVTLLGQGTGATLTSLLLLSPITQGTNKLFHRAILASGSSLAHSATVRDPVEVTRQVAAGTGCGQHLGQASLPDCLRGVEIGALLEVELKTQPYSSPVGPHVDGTILPRPPDQLMRTYSANHDLMFGLTQSEAFHLFPAFTATYGLTDTEQRNILRSLLESEFGVAGEVKEQIVKMVSNEYRDFQQLREDKQVNLKMLLDIFSDARVVAPLLRAANLHSGNQRASYLYIFDHVTQNGYYPPQFGSVHGEDLAYMLGMPLVGGTYHLAHNYTQEEVELAKHTMHFLVNFATTGNPGSRSFPGLTRHEKVINWDKYEEGTRRHLVLGTRPEMAAHYRADKTALWNKLIPDLIESYNITRTPGHGSSPGPGGSTVYGPGLGRGHSNRSEAESGLVNLAKQDEERLEIVLGETNLPISIIVIIGLIFLLFNLLACAGVYYQKQKVKRRELNLERRIKRMSDAGFVMDESASHQSGLIVDSNVERETRDEGHYASAAAAKRPHFQLRSNSVRERDQAAAAGGSAEQSKIVLKSALKKSNTSAEILTEASCRDTKCLLYSEQTFADAAYPRGSKSIPNINHLAESQNNDSSKNDSSLSRVSREKQLSKSSTYLEKERRARGADELVLYDSMPSPTASLERRAGPGKQEGALARMSSLLRGGGLKTGGRPPSPIIEMVPSISAAPSTYSFPSRQAGPGPEPIYTTRPLLHPGARPRGPALATPYGIAYPIYRPGQEPVYSHTGSLPRPLYPGLPGDGYISMLRPGLTTPGTRPPGLHLPLATPELASTLPRPRLEAVYGPRPGPGGPRPPPASWTGSLQHPSTIYGSQQPPRPPLMRLNSVDSATAAASPRAAAPDLVPVKRTNATSQTPLAPVKPPASSLSSVTSASTVSSSASSPPSSSSPTAPSSTVSSASSSPASVSTSTAKKPSLTNGGDNHAQKNPFEADDKTSQDAVTEPEEASEDSSDPDGEKLESSSPQKTPVLSRVGEKTPPNTLKRDRSVSSCKSWYSQYSQGFLSKTIDTPDIELPPLGDEEDDHSEEVDKSADTSPNNERRIK